MITDKLLERDLLPDQLIRQGIRRLLRQRLHVEDRGSEEAQQAHTLQLIEQMKQSPIAIETKAANEQHYEVPTDFYRYVLGSHMKYSSGYWASAEDSLPIDAGLDASEDRMLVLTCERAELADGQQILELGCGWGSLSLFMAARYPKASITAVSNSKTQKHWIDSQARERGLTNLTIVTADMNAFSPTARFDRVVSVEMFEHMRNYQELLRRIAGWLGPGGKLFVHIFVHRAFTYFFEDKDPNDWMSRYFFTGGIMPSDHLLFYFQDDLHIESHWRVDGTHYQKTSEAWLARMDAHRAQILPLLQTAYGTDQALKWWSYWRIFFMSCAELWGYRQGREWFVSHYRFAKR